MTTVAINRKYIEFLTNISVRTIQHRMQKNSKILNYPAEKKLVLIESMMINKCLQLFIKDKN